MFRFIKINIKIIVLVLIIVGYFTSTFINNIVNKNENKIVLNENLLSDEDIEKIELDLKKLNKIKRVKDGN